MKPFFSWRQAVLASTLSPTTRHVLLTLACHMNDAGESCYPSVSLLSRETGLDRTTIMTHLKVAATAGWITVMKHGLNGQRWARNEYAMAWPKAVGESDHLQNKAVGLTDKGGRIDPEKAVVQVDPSTSVNSTVSTPEWVDKDAWARWEQHRREKRKRLTPSTRKAQIKFLSEHQQDHVEIIDQSIRCGWEGLFPLKNGSAPKKGRMQGLFEELNDQGISLGKVTP